MKWGTLEWSYVDMNGLVDGGGRGRKVERSGSMGRGLWYLVGRDARDETNWDAFIALDWGPQTIHHPTIGEHSPAGEIVMTCVLPL